MPGTVLLRVCAVPVETVLAAGNPPLFAEAADLRADAEAHAERGRALAAALQHAINRAPMERAASRRLGAAASRVARGAPVGDVAAHDPAWEGVASGLLARLRAHEAERAALDARAARTQARLAEEPARSAHALWLACRDRWATAALIRHADGAFFERCAAAGDEPAHWRGKPGRRRAGYLLGILSRAAFRTVPRGWHVQVAALPLVADSPNGSWRGAVSAEPDLAAIWTENMHALERELAEGWSPGLRGAVLALAPIRRAEGDRLAVLATDRDDPREVREVSLRVDPLLAALFEALAPAARSFAALRSRVAARRPPEDLDLLEGVVAHLVRLGVLRVARAPRTRILGWAADAPARERLARAAGRLPGRPAYLDLYGRVRGGLARDDARALQDGFVTAARLALAIERDAAAGRAAARGPAAGPAGPDAETPLLDAVHARLLAASRREAGAPQARSAPEDGPAPEPAGGAAAHWVAPSDPSGPYARLHARIAGRLGSAEAIELGDEDLREAGVPPLSLRWPADAMIRLARGEAGFLGVLDEAFPAGSMDARFVGGAERLGLSLDQARWYRRFLEALERRGEHRLVELVFPPLSLGAANAVRRPPLLRTWTGDAAAAACFLPRSKALRFLPLDRLTLRVRGGVSRLWSEDRPVLPFYHATRLPVAPWSIVAETMLGAAPARMRWGPRRLHRLLDAFPDAERAPRLQTRTGLVVSCAQWRLPREPGWHPRDAAPTKAAGLAALRRRLGLPRVVFLSPGPGRRPVPCDLDSVWAVPLIEAARGGATDLLAMEMTPDAAHALPRERDATGAERGRLSCGLIRLPLDAAPEAFAEEVAPDLR